MVFRRNFSVGREDELIAEIERLRAAMGKILSLQPLKRQHEHYIAMLKTLDIVRQALNGSTGSD